MGVEIFFFPGPIFMRREFSPQIEEKMEEKVGFMITASKFIQT